jgi:outer membrane protein assembly factor BamB
MRKTCLFAIPAIVPLVGAVMSLALSGCASADLHAGSGGPSWPRWRGPAGNGVSAETGWNPAALIGGPRILWKVNIGIGWTNPVIEGNRLYVLGRKGKTNYLLAMDTQTGKQIWRQSHDNNSDAPDPQSTPTIDGTSIYVAYADGFLYCVNLKNGTVRWKRDLPRELGTETIAYGYSSCPIVEGDLVILNVGAAGIALDKESGKLVWMSPPSTMQLVNGYHATPVLYDRHGTRSVLLFPPPGLVSVEAATGRQQWQYELGDNPQGRVPDPVVVEGNVFVRGAVKSTLLDVSGSQPKVVWETDDLASSIATSVYFNGYLYGSHGSGNTYNRVQCLDAKTGRKVWETPLLAFRMASLTVADGKLIIMEENGILHVAAATPSAYKEMAQCDVLGGENKPKQFWVPPVLCGGRIYCRNYIGDLVCIDVGK